MDNIRNVIKIFFRYTSPTEVLLGNTSYDNVRKESFTLLANAYMHQYSNNEIDNMFSFLNSQFEWHKSKIRGKAKIGRERNINVFDSILLFSDNVLVEENGVPLCRYENLLRWRDMIVALEEDLFITAYLAQKDLLCNIDRSRFFWSPVIGHNNKELNRLLAKGVAENHFHLKGSAPLFHLSWISMMNNVSKPEFKTTLDSYDKRRLHTKVNYQTDFVDSSLYVSFLQAALIRLYLFASLRNELFTLGEMYVEFEKIERYLNENADRADKKYKVKLEDYKPFFYNLKDYEKVTWDLLKIEVAQLLKDSQEIQNRFWDIQNAIEYMQERCASEKFDYVLCFEFLRTNPDRHINEVICGERWFLYEIFRKIYSNDKKFQTNLNWFYVYLLIKENIRSELIQANENVGFHNFLLYQNRKEAFIDNTPFEEIYLRMAVRDTILNQHIKKLEARIAPKNTAEELKKAIRKNDNRILKLEQNPKELRDKFFYVCHFIKSADEEYEQPNSMLYRHYRKRLEVKRQAYALLEFRRSSTELAERIRGIDASSEEIVCRPEVFAQAFRFLKGQSAELEEYNTGIKRTLPDMCVTYHVGEDFLDILDGLRAIDEAIVFFNMRCGDRLGHALALGVDVEEWYESKSNYILISQMDYLDNLVWLYGVIRKYRLEGLEEARCYIEKRYNEYFRTIYLNNMSEKHLKYVISEAREYYAKEEIEYTYANINSFSIDTYYDSWKLRGDNPAYFEDGFFQLNTFSRTEWDEYGINKIFPDNYQIRYNPEAAYLYHTYHFNEAVKREGRKTKEIKVKPCIIKAVKAVQKKMQWVVAQKGIAIETNPSSNAMIGTFKRYDKHPILNWYNNGIITDWEEISNVPQIQVSINTDDQGVFATYIENEYAYLALALEKLRDENGNPRYSRSLIYKWLDNIRKMGLVQSFEEIVE